MSEESAGGAIVTRCVRMRRLISRAVAIALFVAACSRPLPDAESPGARAYAEACGVCHAPVQPGSMTPAMWRIQFRRMEEIRRRRGLPEIDDEARELILGYLDAHAG